jgi:hypothetical protein
MQITFRFVVAILLFSLLIQEAHELSHMLVNKLLAVCVSRRYFLYWEMCDTGNKYSSALLAFAGPFVNFIFMWTGYGLLAIKSTPGLKSYGFSFIMAALPLQRLQGIVFRGSDEIFAFKKLLAPGESFKGASVLAGAMLIVLLAGPPLYRSFLRVKDKKNGLLILIAGLLLPFIVITLLQAIIFNTAFQTMLSASTGFMPSISWLFLTDAILLLLFIPFRRSLAGLWHR